MKNNIQRLRELALENGLKFIEEDVPVLNKGTRPAVVIGGEDTAMFMMTKEAIETMDGDMDDIFKEQILGICSEKVKSVDEHVVELIEQGAEIMASAFNRAANEAFLANIVHRDVMNLSIAYHVVAVDKDSVKTILVPKSVESYISEEELFQRAKQYALLHQSHMTIGDTIRKCIKDGALTMTDEIERMLQDESADSTIKITYDFGGYGSGLLALAAFDEDILGMLCEENSMIVIPSSIHEVVFMEDKPGVIAKIVADDTVRNGNLYRTPVSEWLSNSVYILNKETKKVECFDEGVPLLDLLKDRESLENLVNEMFE